MQNTFHLMISVLILIFSISACSSSGPNDLTSSSPDEFLCDTSDVNACIDAFSQGCKDGGGSPECKELGESMVINCECNTASASISPIDQLSTEIKPEPKHHCPSNDHLLDCIIAYCAGCGAAGGTDCNRTNTDDGVDLTCSSSNE